MGLLIVSVIAVFFAVIFMILWIKEKKHANDAEVVAYGLRAADDSDDNTKTSISAMESEYNEAITKLVELNQIHQDEWGVWVWSDTGEKLGEASK